MGAQRWSCEPVPWRVLCCRSALDRDGDEQCTCRSRGHGGLSHRALDDHHHDISRQCPSTTPRTGSLGKGIDASADRVYRVRATALGPESSTPFPGDPKASVPNPGELVDLAGTVVDESGRTWVLDVNTVTNNVIAGGVSLVGLCGHGRPAPASQGPGTVNYPCRELQIDFSNGNLNPNRATLASWSTVQSIGRLPLDVP